MKSHVDLRYIINIFSDIHLLPLNEQNKELDNIIHYLNINHNKSKNKRNNISTAYLKLINEALKSINKNMSINTI